MRTGIRDIISKNFLINLINQLEKLYNSLPTFSMFKGKYETEKRNFRGIYNFQDLVYSSHNNKNMHS